MSDEQNAIVAALDGLPLEEIGKYSKEYFNPQDDVDRVPSFDGRFLISKVKNDSLVFEFNDELHKEMSGVVVEFHLTKTWYQIGFDESGGGNRPDCYSNDSITPLGDSPKKQAEKCATCPKNRFEPDPKRAGKKKKECRDTITLYIWNPKFERPILLRVSTMNRKRVSDFIKALGEKGIAKELVAVKLSLFKDAETADVAFAGLKITPFATIMQMVGFFKDIANKEYALQWFTEDELKRISPEMIVKRISKFKLDNKELFETEGALAGDSVEEKEVKTESKPEVKTESKVMKPTPNPSASKEPDEVEESEAPF